MPDGLGSLSPDENLAGFCYKLNGTSDSYHFSLATDPNECGITVVSEGGRRYSSISEIVPARDRRDVRFLLSSPVPRRDSDTMNGKKNIFFDWEFLDTSYLCFLHYLRRDNLNWLQ